MPQNIINQNKRLESKQMGKQKFTRSTKILSVLSLVFFVISVTAASASGNVHIDASAHDRDASASKKNDYGSRDYKIGSLSGSQYGYKEGNNAVLKDFLNIDKKEF